MTSGGCDNCRSSDWQNQEDFTILDISAAVRSHRPFKIALCGLRWRSLKSGIKQPCGALLPSEPQLSFAVLIGILRGGEDDLLKVESNILTDVKKDNAVIVALEEILHQYLQDVKLAQEVAAGETGVVEIRRRGTYAADARQCS